MGHPHRIGVIGLGVIWGQYRATLAERNDVVITAVADLDSARAAEVASSLGTARALSVAELLAADDVDVVLNLTIPAAHAEIIEAAIAAGKDVYTEKPLATTHADAEKLVARADAAGVRLGCAPDTVLGTGVQTARAVIDAGRIGRPIAATAVMASPGHESWHPNPDFYYLAGGGPLLDMGPYYVAALVHLLGPVESVIGAASRLRSQRVIATGPRQGQAVSVEVDTHVTGALIHEGGAISTITTSFDSVATTAGPIEVHGELASLAVPDPNHFDGEVAVRMLGSSTWETIDPSVGTVNAGRGIGLLDLMSTPRGTDSRASGRFGLHCLEAMSSLLESAGSGRRIEIAVRGQRPSAVARVRG